MMVAVLLGALSLGACVDNDESASVTNVREAKAAQLESVAALNNAEAQAKKVLADAQAALMAAQAEVEKANAAKIQAETAIAQKQLELIELQKKAAELANEAAATENEKRKEELKALQIENEQARAALDAQMQQWELQKKEAEQRLAEIAAEMEQQEIQAQVTLAQLQLQLKQAQQDLVDYDQQIADAKTEAEKAKLEAEKAKLQQLSMDYTSAVNELIAVKSSLSSMNRMLVSLEAGLVSAKEMKQKAIADNNNTIAANEKTIATYKQYANYTEDVSTLRSELDNISREAGLKWDAYQTAVNNVQNVPYPDMTAYLEAYRAIRADSYYKFAMRQDWTSEDNTTSWDWYQYVSPYIRQGNFIYSQTEYYYAGRTIRQGETYEFVNCSYNDNQMDFRNYEIMIKEQVANRETWKANAKKYLDEYTAQYSGKAFKYNPATGKNDLPIRNAVDSTLYLKDKWEKTTDAAKKAELKALYEEAISNENSLKEGMGYQVQAISDYERGIKLFTDALFMFQNSESLSKALIEKVDALNQMDKVLYAPYITAYQARIDAEDAYTSVVNKQNAILAILNGVGNQDGAAWLADRISDLEATNARLKVDNEDISSITSQEEAIAEQKARIAAQELVVKAVEVKEADLKAQLDAALKAAGITE